MFGQRTLRPRGRTPRIVPCVAIRALRVDVWPAAAEECPFANDATPATASANSLPGWAWSTCRRHGNVPFPTTKPSRTSLCCCGRITAKKKMFVHCRLGDERTSMMIASYRMTEENWSAERAEKEMEKSGFTFLHRQVICIRLLSYVSHFPERFRTSLVFRELR